MNYERLFKQGELKYRIFDSRQQRQKSTQISSQHNLLEGRKRATIINNACIISLQSYSKNVPENSAASVMFDDTHCMLALEVES